MRTGYYYPNKTITVNKRYKLSITTSGTVYHDSSSGFHKLESLWQGKINILSVVLPSGKTIKLRPTKEGLEVIE